MPENKDSSIKSQSGHPGTANNSATEFAKEISPAFNSDSCVKCGFKCIEGSV